MVVCSEWQLIRPVSVRCSRLGTKVPVFSIQIHLTQIWNILERSDWIPSVVLQCFACRYNPRIIHHLKSSEYLWTYGMAVIQVMGELGEVSFCLQQL